MGVTLRDTQKFEFFSALDRSFPGIRKKYQKPKGL
jgi:hypothetical protein